MRTPSELKNLVKAIQGVLTDDDLDPVWREKKRLLRSPDPMFGHCAAASGAFWWLAGGEEHGWQQRRLDHSTFPQGLGLGETHYFVRHLPTGTNVDPTETQFQDLTVPHDASVGAYMQTNPARVGGILQPQQRARAVANRVLATASGRKAVERALAWVVENKTRENPYSRMIAVPKKVRAEAHHALVRLFDPRKFENLRFLATEKGEDYAPSQMRSYMYDLARELPITEERLSAKEFDYQFSGDSTLQWEAAYAGGSAEKLRKIAKQIKRTSNEIAEYATDWFPNGIPPWGKLEHEDLKYVERIYEYSKHLEPALVEVAKAVNDIDFVIRWMDYVVGKYAWYVKAYNEQNQDSKGRDARPPDVDQFEIVWHATTAYSKIMADGFKTREEIGNTPGLGGGVNGISFTGSKSIADGIAEAIIELSKYLRGPRTLGVLKEWAKEIGVTDRGIDDCMKYFHSSHRKNQDEDTFTSHYKRVNYEDNDRLPGGAAAEAFQRVLMEAHSQGIAYEPGFWGINAEWFEKLDISDIGVIEATIDTTNNEVIYLRGEDEWRVPRMAIISYGPVGSQQAGLAQG